MQAIPRLLALSTAVPRYRLAQSDVVPQAARLFAGVVDNAKRFQAIYQNSEIDTRYSCVPLEWYGEPHSFTERNELYVENALALIEEAAQACLNKAGVDAEAVDGLTVVSTTGIATPSLDARLMARMPFRRDLERLPIFGLGCAGGVLGLARTATRSRAEPERLYLVVVVELCGLTFRHADRSKSNLVATALFGDGAAAALISCRGDGAALTAWGEHTWPDSLDVMGWGVSDDGLSVIFSRDIPTIVRDEFHTTTIGFLERHGRTLSDIDSFVCHPGGAKVLDALEDVLQLARGGLHHSRRVLRDYGNMSAATVLFVLDEALRSGDCGRFLVSSLGPGFTCGFMTLETS